MIESIITGFLLGSSLIIAIGAQNIFVQLYYRYKYNKNISNWLDSFLDQYFLKKT